MTSTEPTEGEPAPQVSPPAAPTGTKYDGDPLFEALVFGWACAYDGWNGATEHISSPLPVRTELAGYFEQYLEQQGDSSGDELREQAAAQVFGRGQLVWIGENGVPVVLTVAETYSSATADMLELLDKGREQILISSLLRWALRRIGETA